VAPSGIPTRPTVDDEGREDGAVVLPAHAIDEPPESPPPSNKAPGDAVLPVPAQPAKPCEGLIGEMPGVVISVEPSGMPTGCVDCGLSGDVASMPAGGCAPGTVVWAIAAAEVRHRTPIASVARGCIKVNRRDPDRLALPSFDECCFRMEECSG
jgi:hypothetical protein